MTIPLETHLKIGALIFPGMDQCDFTGPFEALARTPNSTFFTIWKDKEPVRDLAGMLLLADTTLDEAPQLDVLLVPGGYGQQALMHDEVVLSFIRQQAEVRVLGVHRSVAVWRGWLAQGQARDDPLDSHGNAALFRCHPQR
jgi:cyclohexyl-isocyanide hydratase